MKYIFINHNYKHKYKLKQLQMFWLFDKINPNFSFIMKFINIECHITEDDEDVYEFKNINSIIDFKHNINCEVTIIENLIRYKTNKINYCFEIKKEESKNNSILYTYEIIDENKFPYIKNNDYDFLNKVNFKIMIKNNGDLYIKEEINNEYRYYEISIV